ncbi:MAG: ABC transporter permease [Phycisphaerae bacterium]
MSNAENIASKGLAVAPVVPDAGDIKWDEDPRRQTYWAVVGRAYWRSALSRLATFWSLLIVALSAFVPFIANDAPITAIIHGKREWPLFRDLTTVDLVWLSWFFAGLLFLFVHWRTGKKIVEVEPLRVARYRWFILIAIGASIVTFGLAVDVGSAIALFLAPVLSPVRFAKACWYSPHWSQLIVLILAGLIVFGLVRAQVRMRHLAIVAAIYIATSVVCTASSAALHHVDYLDARDYHQLAKDGSLQHAVFPLWHWGFADQEPLEANRVYEYPTKDHWLGTDGNGRDAIARLLWGARVVLEIGLVSEIIALIIGVLYGAMMGYFVGTVDLLGMRFVEIVDSIPTLFLLITFVALFGRHLFMIMVILGLVGWTGIARFVRAEFLRLRQLDYVAAARALGLPLRSILFKHMLPNGLTPVIVTFTFGVAANVVSESILSFLGIGVEPPTPSWGSMLNEAGNPAETFRWWLAIAPGLMIFLTVFAYNIIGEGLRDAIDPRLNKTE